MWACSRAGRFIPACAGNSPEAPTGSRRATVHPRVCGELDYEHQSLFAENGSSPRVRGTRRRPGRPADVRRFIPACAGNSASARTSSHVWPVHPRVCGELAARINASAPTNGSSPRVRGTRPRCPSCRRTTTVHPRVCGELDGESAVTPLRVGSSPRVRGTLVLLVHRVQGARFIPACAGNSLPAKDRGVLPVRFIPACAGNSPLRPAANSPRTVHPRVCGELLVRTKNQEESPRFIPACAGNSQA